MSAERLSLVSRLNIQAELATVRAAVESGDAAQRRLAVLTLRKNIASAVGEFQVRQRIYPQTIHIVRRRLVDDRVEYRTRYFNPENPEERLHSADDIDRYDDVFRMQHNYIVSLKARLRDTRDHVEKRNIEQMLERAEVHLQAFRSIITSASRVLDSSELNGAVFLLSSLPPLQESEAQGLGVDSKNGYALNGFYRVRRISDDEAYVDFRNFRSELSVWHHLWMMYQMGDEKSRTDVLQLFRPDVRSLDVLQTPVLLQERFREEDFNAFIEKQIYPKMQSKILNLVFAKYAGKERRYLETVLHDQEIENLMEAVREEMQFLEEAILGNAPITQIIALYDNLQKVVEERTAGILHDKNPQRSLGEYVTLLQANSTGQNPDCPSSGEKVAAQQTSVEVEQRGGKFYLDGEEVKVMDVACRGLKNGEPCKWKGKNIQNGRLYLCCPECGWRPCDGDLAGEWYAGHTDYHSDIDHAKNSGVSHTHAQLRRRPPSAVQRVTDNSPRGTVRYFKDEVGANYTVMLGLKVYAQPLVVKSA